VSSGAGADATGAGAGEAGGVGVLLLVSGVDEMTEAWAEYEAREADEEVKMSAAAEEVLQGQTVMVDSTVMVLAAAAAEAAMARREMVEKSISEMWGFEGAGFMRNCIE